MRCNNLVLSDTTSHCAILCLIVDCIMHCMLCLIVQLVRCSIAQFSCLHWCNDAWCILNELYAYHDDDDELQMIIIINFMIFINKNVITIIFSMTSTANSHISANTKIILVKKYLMFVIFGKWLGWNLILVRKCSGAIWSEYLLVIK